MSNYIISPDEELYHANKNWKYIKREKVNGKWKYTYPDDNAGDSDKSSESDEKSRKSSSADKTEKGKNVFEKILSKKTKKPEVSYEATIKTVNSSITKGLDAVNKMIPKVVETVEDTIEDNKFIVNRSNRSEKIAEIEKTKEWQDIVERADPEYVTKDSEGNVKYLIDDYIVKKKHPELDLLDDIASGRNLTLNEINMETFVAGASDYIRTGAIVLGVVSKVLMTKFKFAQGGYQEQEEELIKMVTKGSDFVVETLADANMAKNVVMNAAGQVDKEQLTSTIKSVVEQVDTDEVAEALKTAAKNVSTDELVTMIESLSEEELRRLLQSINV